MKNIIKYTLVSFVLLSSSLAFSHTKNKVSHDFTITKKELSKFGKKIKVDLEQSGHWVTKKIKKKPHK